MIKYNAVQNRYLYRTEDIEKILDIIQNSNYYNDENIEKYAPIYLHLLNMLMNL